MIFNPDYLMYCATATWLFQTVPELYANYVNKNANAYNLPEKILGILGLTFGLAYAVTTDEKPLMINYSTFIGIEIVALGMRCFYAYNPQLNPQRIELEQEKAKEYIEKSIEINL